MFRATGRSYSVGNSDDTVMSTASEVVPSVEDDGFARTIADLAAAGWMIDEDESDADAESN
jgi:hydroxymethylpyrimidine pyrophosphatase-like HAD family hydrolase